MKVAIIGGGSFLWAFGFARQFVLSEHLSDLHLTLMDIDPEALELVAAAAERVNRAHGSPMKMETTTELTAALGEADFVVTCISTGGLDAMRHDLEIPERYGIPHTVGDTLGPGGWLRAVRNIPVFYDFAARMAECCPDAWLLNVSNPLTVLTRVPEREFGIHTVGMCPGVDETVHTLVKAAGLNPEHADFVVAGIDHGSWFIRLTVDGIDVLERLREMGFCVDTEDGADIPSDDPDVRKLRAAFALWRLLGYLPAINDRHHVENVPWFLPEHTEPLPYGVARTFIDEREAGRRERREKLQHYVNTSDDAALAALGHGDDPLVAAIESLTGHRTLTLGANYRNDGQIDALPRGAVVETRCRFDGAGVHPFTSPLPPVLQPIVLPIVLRQEQMVDIALHGSFDDLVALIATDPLCSRLPFTQCRRMVREMLEANRALIRNPKLLVFENAVRA